MKLYLVENSNYLRERLTRLVGRRQNVQVVGYAATARQAIDDIRRLNPDVVLLDIRLDQGTGLDVLKAIKTRGKPPVVIVLTNYAYPQYRERYLASGAEYFFDKSAELDLMLEALESLRYRFPGTLTASPNRHPQATNARQTTAALQASAVYGGENGH